MSSDCSFDFHISNLVKRTKHLTGWILRTFSFRDKLTMLTLFKALVMSRLDYGCQLWSPYLIKHINMVEKVQRSFTRFISGMAGLSYTEVYTGYGSATGLPNGYWDKIISENDNGTSGFATCTYRTSV